jgi:O-antigen/teichoic acid export membrane protein
VSYVGCLLSFVVLRADMLMVNAILGTAAAGIYSIAAQIGEALLLLPVTVGMILFPRIAAADPGAREAITARVARHTVLLNTLACGAAFVVAGPVIVGLYGEPFRPAVAATRWLLPGIWALGLHSVLMNHFAGQGMPPVTILAPAAGAALNVALNAWALPRFGVVAASITSSAAYGAMLAVSLGVFLKSGRAGLRDSLLVAPGEVIGLLRARL